MTRERRTRCKSGRLYAGRRAAFPSSAAPSVELRPSGPNLDRIEAFKEHRAACGAHKPVGLLILLFLCAHMARPNNPRANRMVARHIKAGDRRAQSPRPGHQKPLHGRGRAGRAPRSWQCLGAKQRNSRIASERFLPRPRPRNRAKCSGASYSGP